MGVSSFEKRFKDEYYSHLEFDSLNESQINLRRKARHGGHSFFGAARIAHNPELLRLGIMKRLFTGLRTEDSTTNTLYRNWVSRRLEENLEVAQSTRFLTQSEISDLVVAKDPALLAISALEQFRQDRHSGIVIEKPINPELQSRLETVYQSYETLLSSVHKS